MKKRFEDRILCFSLPPDPAGETPGVSAVEHTRGWLETDAPKPDRLDGRRGLYGLPRRAFAQTVPRRLRPPGVSSSSLSFFPDGNSLISAGRDSFVKFWTIPGAALFRTVSTYAVPFKWP